MYARTYVHARRNPSPGDTVVRRYVRMIMDRNTCSL